MRLLYKGSLIPLLAIGFVLPLFAQDRPQADLVPPDVVVSPSVALPSNAPAMLTGKERLGPKWTDEQRVDNCNVPVDKRGTKPRPSACPHIPND